MSTFDRRRVQAPESSSAPVYHAEGDAGPSKPSASAPGEICVYPTPSIWKVELMSSPQDRPDQSSQRQRLYRIRERQDCVLCVGFSPTWADGRYGPRPKQPPYSPRGSLNLELKFAPFASHPRRAPLRVSLVTPDTLGSADEVGHRACCPIRYPDPTHSPLFTPTPPTQIICRCLPHGAGIRRRI
jgi:hypothetical protein